LNEFQNASLPFGQHIVRMNEIAAAASSNEHSYRSDN
jgi:hypothetical protein